MISVYALYYLDIIKVNSEAAEMSPSAAILMHIICKYSFRWWHFVFVFVSVCLSVSLSVSLSV